MQIKNAEHVHHILPLKVYLGVGATLMVMTAITVIVAQFDFGEMNLIVAMLIASFKALLVAFFFMHLWYDNKLFFGVFALSVLFLALFITFTMLDTERRGETNEIVRDPIEDKAVIYQPGYQAEQAHEGDGGSGAQNADTSEAAATHTQDTSMSSRNVAADSAAAAKSDTGGH